MKILTLIVFAYAACGARSEASPFLNKLTEKSARQKRLLFYDEQGRLVKTYGNPLYHIGQNDQDNLFYWSFLNTFLSPIFPTNLGKTSIAYMVPVSDAVIQKINKDPIYQNKLFILTYRDPIVEVNPLCAGKRAQIPSPNLCNNFLNCWDGWAFEQECPTGLVFSNEGFCDYPYNVDCRDRKLKDPRPPCSKDFEAFSNEADCNEFFVCVSGLPVRFKCPADLVYSENLGVCDYKSRVQCNVTFETTKTPSITQMTPSSSEASSIIQNVPDFTAPAIPSSTTVPTDKKVVLNKMEYNTQIWSSTHVAFSRQDAIRQLELSRMDRGNEDN
ncbi:uncharacterized protein LOC113392336 [Vanessa tameamea]|uniref:Uncharacterized protein LOC113392336 n=1 Tax=Vanessa tameamea TaxID=334116 RepID=A0A8B8HI36_VANTA